MTIFRTIICLSTLAVVGCTQSRDAGSERLAKVLVPGYQTPSLVLFSSPNTESCKLITAKTMKVASLVAKGSPFKDGYSNVRIGTGKYAYRAFFTKAGISRFPDTAGFVFCAADSTPIGQHCAVVGIAHDRCFETSYGWYKLSEIDSLLAAIYQKAAHLGSGNGT